MDFFKERIRSLASRPGLVSGWIIAVGVAVLAYWPGLSGPFLFDDFGNISALGEMGGVTDSHSFRSFVFGGHAGPTGRPLALLTFLLDANNWPADSWPFKRTNLIIHLVNGLLLGALMQQILKVLRYPSRDAAWIALFAAAIWLLHPFLVSTTLYVVQRMAQLSVLFIFAGLLIYVRARRRVGDEPVRAYWTMSIALPVFTLLSMLSKENGILLPMLAGVIEFTIFRTREVPVNRYWKYLFIGVPSFALLFYLGYQSAESRFFEVVEPRTRVDGPKSRAVLRASQLPGGCIPCIAFSGVGAAAAIGAAICCCVHPGLRPAGRIHALFRDRLAELSEHRGCFCTKGTGVCPCAITACAQPV